MSARARLAGRVAARVPGPLRRAARDAQLSWQEVRHRRDESQRSFPLPGAYFLPGDYRSRAEPAYDLQERIGTNWQQSVYDEAVRVAREQGSRRIVDVGCGDGRKLAALHPEFEVVGVDYGPNLAACRSRYGFGTWIEHDLESEDAVPLSLEHLRGAVVVCADVVEHLVRPERLAEKLLRMLEHAGAVLISTPDRERTHGRRHLGPPPNEGHVREWSLWEFGAWLRASGFDRGTLRLAQSNDVSPERKTILATLLPDD